MGIEVVTGKYIRRIVLIGLGGFGNLPDPDDILLLINEAQTRVYTVLKQAREDWFMQSSQATSADADNYFPALDPAKREFDLPLDFVEMRFMEVTDQSLSTIDFLQRPISHRDFKEARRIASGSGAGGPRSEYFYDIIGRRTLMFAQWPETAMTLRLWYIRSLPQITDEDLLEDIMHPYATLLATWVIKRLMLGVQEHESFDRWEREWKEDVRQAEVGARGRDTTGPHCVEDFDV
jgi:hypothetical protein